MTKVYISEIEIPLLKIILYRCSGIGKNKYSSSN